MTSILPVMQMTIQFMTADKVDVLFTSLEQTSNGLFEWVNNNLLKSSEKCHLLLRTNDRVSMIVNGFIKIDKSDTEKLIGVKFDRKVTFDNHISDICKKEVRKISALAKVTPYIGIAKKRILMNAFFTPQFS